MTDRKRKMSDEDRALWKTTTDTVDPLEDRGRVTSAGDDARVLSIFLETPDVRKQPPGKPSISEVKRTSAMPSYSPPASDNRSQDGLFESKRARKLARGQMSIDARIDLHGMRQEEARRALRSFILSAHSRDARNVLVITGKGRSGGDAAWYEPNQRGVLRQEVPRWLMSSDFSQVVVGHTAAHPRHGGEGALYVQLRARRKLPGRSSIK